MKRFTLALATVALFATGSAATWAQGPGFGGPGGFQPSPQMMAKFKAWQQWRSSHRNVESLQQSLRGLTALEQDPKTQLTKPQAKVMLAVLNKWRGKSALTDAQAQQVNRQLTNPLTLSQLKAFAAATSRHGGRGGRGGGGGFGGGGGRPGGGGGGGGMRGGMDPASFPAPKDYNPLNPSTLPFPRMRDRVQQQLTQLVSALKAAH